MPLLDHFHPPLSDERHWESFHGVWAAEIMAFLHRGMLPKGYFAEVQIHIGGVEVGVATLEKTAPSSAFEEGNGGVAVEVEPADGKIEVRCVPLSIGQALPRMPLSLRRGPTVVIDLEATYTEARLRSQL